MAISHNRTPNAKSRTVEYFINLSRFILKGQTTARLKQTREENKKTKQHLSLNLFLTPDIRLDGEGVVCKTFRCSPLDGELGPSVGGVGVTSHQPAQAKVSNFDHMILANQAVSCSKIPEGGKGKHHTGRDVRGRDYFVKRGIKFIIINVKQINNKTIPYCCPTCV